MPKTFIWIWMRRKYIINFNTDDEFQKHINYLQNNSLFINDTAKITKDDKVLIIQTCNYNPPDTFLILIAKEINE